ncbi:hypothetical protein PUW24_22645 [Paenibacillus urinalis]|uniref:Uncharacterized protein n=1 Tax=Paenibacillus urinalis TaxID=521520 RepID=A0ABY7X6P9_9BACL|nr:hypothetical protein [Paenibacillus urinalis]WDH96910.1 hypothetical protein PUW24_22645 [Paenibacillus urinalis]WDI00554.1 hypothetical protein PUW25_14800 [Paenibacillus urinalis]
MNKEQYFKNLEDVITDPIFIGTSIHDLNKEISNNMWAISLEEEIAKELRIEDFLNFFNRLLANREYQVRKANKKQGMIFYLWFDAMASQLRFNLISGDHGQLPFKCELELIDHMVPILEDLLASPYLNGLFTEDDSDDTSDRPYKLKVYKKLLKGN